MSDDAVSRLNAALEGRYAVEGELGEGGMATVYLARDLKHNRGVALKVLKPELAAVVGAERFLTEIETTANLQHPHILPLYDSGEAAGFLYYVMPYVEGESLRDRLDAERQLGVEEAVRIATAVANALDFAHAHGVVHRDIKPGNILFQGGEPVVGDFGIALAVGVGGGARLTETGLSVGTPYYMSPEQATGDQSVGPRSDIYSLGCVLYEMLTGEPPFTGNTAQAVLGRILMGRVEPPTERRRSIPGNVEAAMLKALERLPADRFRTGAGFVEALRDPSFRHRMDGAEAGAAVGQVRPGRWWTTAAQVGAAAVLAGAAGWLVGTGESESGVQQQQVLLGTGPEAVPELVAFRAAIHPEGAGILFADTVRVDDGDGPTLWWKERVALEPTHLPWLDGAVSPTFSQEGDWVLFVRDGELRRMPLVGGNSVLLADGISGGTAHALAWLDDGTVVYENAGFRMERIPDDGRGEPEVVSRELQTGQPIHAAGLPGSWGVLVSACVNSCAAGNRLSLIDLEADTVVPLAEGVVRAWPGPEDHVIYLTREGGVFAAPLDRGSRSLGSPTPLFDGVRVSSDSNGEMHVSPSGTALFVRGNVTAESSALLQVDRSGRGVGFGDDGARWAITHLALSPTADRLAVAMWVSGRRQIWVRETVSNAFLPVTPFETDGLAPVWHRDGTRISYVSIEAPGGVRTVRSDGSSGTADTLLLPRSGLVGEVALTPGADTVVAAHLREGQSEFGLTLFDLAEGGEPVVVAGDMAIEPRISPDGRWLAYSSNLSGTREVYVQELAVEAPTRTLVSRGGGSAPIWGPSGQELFYQDGDEWLVAVAYSADPDFRVEGRERLFDASGYVAGVYDVFPGEEGFLMLGPFGTVVGDGDALILYEGLFETIER